MGGLQGRDLKVGTEAEIQRNATCWLSLDDFLSVLSYTTQDWLSKDDTTPNGLGPPTSISNQEMPYRLAYRQPDGGIFLIEVLFPCDASCIKLTIS